jgi:hypothetical protein
MAHLLAPIWTGNAAQCCGRRFLTVKASAIFSVRIALRCGFYMLLLELEIELSKQLELARAVSITGDSTEPAGK